MSAADIRGLARDLQLVHAMRCWRCDGAVSLMEDQAQSLARNLIELRHWRPPARVVSTVEELEALPQWTLIRSHIGELYERLADKWDCLSEGGDTPLRTSAFVLRNQHQISVLWEPDGGGPR